MIDTALPMLDKKLLEEELLGTEIADYSAEVLNYSERVLQIGEGNFLRAFVNWMFHEMNKEGVFKGRAVVVQPIKEGRVSNLNKQDSLYTLYLRGIEDGEVINQKEIISSISRGLEANTDWEEVLKLAEKPEMEFVVSNTTEAGIVYDQEDKLTDTPPKSYPAKLAAYLYRRFECFDGAKDKGMVIIPVELIDRNGDKLKEIIIKLAKDWDLPEEFIAWIEEANYFLNTLVDRIVTGYPFNEVEELEEELGYHDQNLDTGEIFHLWVIEGDEQLKERLPFHKVGLNVKWVDDLTPYRTTKVRILNGAHTSTVPVSYLAGIDLVRDAVNDELVGEFIKQAVFEDIIPTLDADEQELESFANKIFDRFKNPYIDHKWLDISLNSTSKFKTRVLPSLVKYIEIKDELPKRLVFALAALIAFYQGTEIRDNKLVATRDDKEYLIRDNKEALEFFCQLWTDYEGEEIDLEGLVKRVLANQDFWGRDLNDLANLTEQVESYLLQIISNGMVNSLKVLL
ncbi:tagaturonate reductase [Orenia metallireducens]|jgi:tagaturonate reductase|uniref:Tagaturonate reductase n=1 Tax=Orenia metallireducens TaxID=1413210 RepID=A0A285G7Y7_9FIRM|nr:tagaturonate reductase [Orenia metallireducens]PRX28282.1 tagaturonate reductase [Orenia metallireducens]SNY19528.1 tagaturonate reductase [Orenia metallireducens]